MVVWTKIHAENSDFNPASNPTQPLVFDCLHPVWDFIISLSLFLDLGVNSRCQDSPGFVGPTPDLGDMLTHQSVRHDLVLVHLETLGLLVILHASLGRFHCPANRYPFNDDQG